MLVRPQSLRSAEGPVKPSILFDPIKALTGLLGSIGLGSAQTAFGQADPNGQLILRIDPLFGSDIMVRPTHIEVEVPLYGSDIMVRPTHTEVDAPICGSAMWFGHGVRPTHTCQLAHVCLTALSSTSGDVTSGRTVMARAHMGDSSRTFPITTLSKTLGVT